MLLVTYVSQGPQVQWDAQATTAGITGGSLEVGTDVDLEFAIGYFYAALVLGITAGYCISSSGSATEKFGGQIVAGNNGFAIDHNLNVLRVGVTW